MYNFVVMINDETIIPFWFETILEKQACLLGYTDADLGIDREREEIIKQIRNGI